MKNFADVIFGITQRNFSNLSCTISAIYSRFNRSSNATFKFSYFEGLINRQRETEATLLTCAPAAVCATSRIWPSRPFTRCPMTFWYFLLIFVALLGSFIISNRNHGLFYYRTFPMILISSIPLWILGPPNTPIFITAEGFIISACSWCWTWSPWPATSKTSCALPHLVEFNCLASRNWSYFHWVIRGGRSLTGNCRRNLMAETGPLSQSRCLMSISESRAMIHFGMLDGCLAAPLRVAGSDKLVID